ENTVHRDGKERHVERDGKQRREREAQTLLLERQTHEKRIMPNTGQRRIPGPRGGRGFFLGTFVIDRGFHRAARLLAGGEKIHRAVEQILRPLHDAGRPGFFVEGIALADQHYCSVTFPCAKWMEGLPMRSISALLCVAITTVVPILLSSMKRCMRR